MSKIGKIEECYASLSMERHMSALISPDNCQECTDHKHAWSVKGHSQSTYPQLMIL